MARHKDKITIAQQETIPNIWNGTMFGDLDWPNVSRSFVSISWASCVYCVTQICVVRTWCRNVSSVRRWYCG